jgi:hypothetical protein
MVPLNFLKRCHPHVFDVSGRFAGPFHGLVEHDPFSFGWVWREHFA